ncbi:MAG: hypothetical protein WDN30_08495 [Pararobbsia sp.]
MSIICVNTASNWRAASLAPASGEFCTAERIASKPFVSSAKRLLMSAPSSWPCTPLSRLVMFIAIAPPP